MFFRKILLGISIATMALSANAGLVSVVGGADYTAPANNDFIAGETYNIGGNVYADYDLELTFTFLGKDAGFDNDFFAAGDSIVINNGDAIGTSFSSFSSAGLIDFRFYSNDAPGGVVNGNNQPFNSPQSFATILDFTWDSGITYDFILFFDDSGANEDDNHDDHIIGVQALRVPTVEANAPSVMAIFGLSLLALAYTKRLKA